MTISEEIESDVGDVLLQKWNVRDGTVVPETEGVTLSGGGVKLEATMLYSDLADSTKIAIYDRRVASRLFKAFLSICSRLIRHNGGYVRSFDGDRVMGVFLGDRKNSRSTICGLNIAWAVTRVLKPRFQTAYQVFKDGTYDITHCVGIDTSEVMVVRGGIIKNNDLVWVGRAPNVAAKLSSKRDSPFMTYISDDVYKLLAADAKVSIVERQNMWNQHFDLTLPTSIVHRSSWWWRP